MSVLLRLPSRDACRRTLLFVSLAAASLGCGGRAGSEGRGASPVVSAGAGGAAGPPDACGDSETAVICDGDAPESAPAGELAGSAQPGCPTSVPVPGSDCEPEGLSCQYRSECSGAVDDDNAHCRFGQWLVEFATTASCDYFGMPVCPERSILDATGCAYEGQTCAPASCPPGTAYREGHVCRNGFWRATALTCPSERDPAYGF